MLSSVVKKIPAFRMGLRTFTKAKRSQLTPFGAKRCSSSAATDMNVYTEKTPITAELWKKRKEFDENQQTNRTRANANANEPVLVSKEPHLSRVDARYEFSDFSCLKSIYTDSFGNVLMGKVLEDLDALAGNVAFFHSDDGIPETSPLSLVTASVENIKILRKSISVNRDLIISGQVVFVGRSSMDVLVEAHQVDRSDAASGEGLSDAPVLIGPEGDKTHVLSSVFTYVARNRGTGKSAQVNPLDTTNMSKYELEFCNARESAMKLRKHMRISPKAQPPKDCIVHMVDEGKSMVDMPGLFYNSNVLMKDTTQENSFICQPQKTNTAGNIFGGFLIHSAFTLAEASVYMFSGRQANLSFVDEIIFAQPVHIGDLIRLRSRVVYVSKELPRRMVCDITVHVVKPEQVKSFLSNKFTYVFTCASEDSHLHHDQVIIPSTAEEANSLYTRATDVLKIDEETIRSDYNILTR
jgi:acyl-coenzyme A thioesterase 9